MSRMTKALHAIQKALPAFLLALSAGLSLTLRADPREATITSPSGAITVATNQSVSFTATSDDSTAPTSSGYTVNS
ncbi:MAG: hypothetical protein HY014_04580, partial [Acidobacteria bacterium]|nr:hypothetical protein [Acidobacteriota bacterium]MBI3487427.1 hypothetical protein [Acidobacteriota bacterium]